MRIPLLVSLVSGVMFVAEARAQHAGHEGHGAAAASDPEPGTMQHMEPGMHHGAMSTSRDGSGTGWLPDSSPVHAIHLMAGGFRLMLHGQLYAGYNWQGSDRGEGQVMSTNWIMAMASRDLAGGELSLRTMLSLEPLTVGEEGYSLLLQSGEAYQGEPLVDRQHPHDLFMELAATYRRPIAGPIGIELYGGPVGEPALGPVAFPHRPSAMPNPLAPLGHHWLDATHISFGVATAGITSPWAKLEGSWFNGRAPDEDRYDFDLRGFDSYAVRLTVAPHRNVSAQASWGALDSPEQLEPDVSVERWTGSVSYNLPFAERGNWASMVAWGRNVPDGGPTTDAFLAESALDTGRWGGPFARLEQVDKAGHDLGLEGAMADETVRVHAVTGGYLYELPTMAELRPGVGVMGTITHLPDDAMASRYGDSTLFAAMAYVTLRPELAATAR
jgi:hypothetical protein